MTAFAASRKWCVPSRTLYYKCKKLGITSGGPVEARTGDIGGREALHEMAPGIIK